MHNDSHDWQLTVLQMCSQPEPAQNLAQISQWLAELPAHRPQLVALPEGALCFGGGADANLRLAEPLGLGPDSPLQQQLSALAAQHQIYLLVGTVPTQTATDSQRFAASSLLFGPDGQLLADYQKIHLFDADVSDSTARYRESDSTVAGSKLQLARAGALNIGMSICYDVRFAGMFYQLAAAGMNLLSVPAAFTTVTGAAHWHVLLRARAIETQSFVLAPAQTGTHANGRQTYGHSLIIDPWGQVLVDAGTAPGWYSTRVDLQQLASVRAKMPLAAHNQFQSQFRSECI